MSYLYIDSSKHLVLGLLDEKFKWMDFLEVKDVKTSAHIHKDIFSMLSRNDLSMDDLFGVFVISGPGSYTGVRVSEGLAQVLEWAKIPVYSFNHFQVPQFLNDNSWIFVSKAFKGEFFIYDNDGNSSLNKLEDFESVVGSSPAQKVYTHFLEDLPPGAEFYTGEIIKENPGEIFPKVLKDKMRSGPFYYRPLEKEFKVKKDASNLS